MRYRLFIKQCVQLAGYQEENTSEQLIVIQFSHDDLTLIRTTARALRSLHSDTDIVIYDSEQDKKVMG